jgi:hypothetical protein
MNAMAGLAVALEAGVDLDAAVAALQTLTAGDKRGEVIEIRGATILNDSYNSNPEALRSMIRTLAARPASRRILVAGEMLELGEHGPALHAACGRAAAEAGLDLVAGVRATPSTWPPPPAPAESQRSFLPDAEAAGRWLKQNLRPGDVVLVKGSRGVHLERAIEASKSQANPRSPNEFAKIPAPSSFSPSSLRCPKTLFRRSGRSGPKPFPPSASPAISITSAAKTSPPISSSRPRATSSSTAT